MPNLVLEEDQYKLQVGPHEVCASCFRQAECPFLKLLQEYQILTYSGLDVFRCAQYDPDETSEFFVAREVREPDVIMGEQLAELGEEAAALLRDIGEAGKYVWSSLKSSATPGQDPHTRPWPRRLDKSTND